jgi:hypothetical protein
MEMPPLSSDGTLPSIHDTSDIWLSDFENDDLIYFTKDVGLSINLRNRTLLLFQKANGEWFEVKLPLGDLRGATEVTGVADEYYPGTQLGGTRGIGQSIGVALRNSMEQAKAKRETGIALHLKSIEQPTLFMQILDAEERKKLMEALRQVLEDQHMRSPYRNISDDVREAYTPLTQADLDGIAAQEQRAKLRATKTRIGLRGHIGVLMFGLLGVLPFYMAVRAYGMKVNGHAVGFYLFDATVYFAICAVIGWISLYAFKCVKFWLWETHQAN